MIKLFTVNNDFLPLIEIFTVNKFFAVNKKYLPLMTLLNVNV